MNMRHAIGSFVILMLTACGGSGGHENHTAASETAKSPSDSVYNLVMEDHNVAMPKMGQLSRYQVAAKKESDSIAGVLAKKKDPALSARKQMLDSLQVQLKTAEDDMDHWMQGFETDSAGTTEESKLKYYTKEKEKVGAIKENMIAVLARADSVLKK